MMNAVTAQRRPNVGADSVRELKAGPVRIRAVAAEYVRETVAAFVADIRAKAVNGEVPFTPRKMDSRYFATTPALEATPAAAQHTAKMSAFATSKPSSEQAPLVPGGAEHVALIDHKMYVGTMRAMFERELKKYKLEVVAWENDITADSAIVHAPTFTRAAEAGRLSKLPTRKA